MSVGKSFLSHWGVAKEGKDFGGKDEALYDGEVDRFRESGGFSEGFGGDGETPERGMQTLPGNSFDVAASAEVGSGREKLPAAR